MSEAYSVYWPQERWRQAVGVIPRLTVLYGGPHSSFEVEYGALVFLPLAPRAARRLLRAASR